MRRFVHPIVVTVLAAITPVAAGQAQDVQDQRGVRPGSGYATVYRDTNMRGPAVAVERPEPRFDIAFPIRSINIRSGIWQLCSERNFRGQCFAFNSSQRNLTNRVPNNGYIRSIRPISLGGPGPGYPGGGGNPGPALRGQTAEFLTQPREGGQRVLACQRGSATAACIQASANAYCQRRGWTRAQHQRGETVNRRVYLMDVLCTRT